MERPVGEIGPNIVSVKPADAALVSRNEKVEFEARKQFYQSLVHEKKKEKKIDRLVFTGKVLFPIFIVFFSSAYFWYGLSMMA